MIGRLSDIQTRCQHRSSELREGRDSSSVWAQQRLMMSVAADRSRRLTVLGFGVFNSQIYWAYWNSGLAFKASFVAPGRTNFLSTSLS